MDALHTGPPDVAPYLLSTVERSADAIFATDLSGCLIYWNPAAEHLFGYEAAEVLGRHASMLHMLGPTPGWVALWSPDFEGATPHAGAISRYGAHLDIRVSISPVRSGGVLIGAATRAHLVPPAGGGERVYVEFDARMDAKMQERTVQVDSMLLLVTHYLRNKMSVVKGYASLMARGPVDRVSEARLAKIVGAVDEMVGIVDDTIDRLGLDDADIGVIWERDLPSPERLLGARNSSAA